jgi:hypothetical protein
MIQILIQIPIQILIQIQILNDTDTDTDVVDDDDDTPIWPTWAVGALLRMIMIIVSPFGQPTNDGRPLTDDDDDDNKSVWQTYG